MGDVHKQHQQTYMTGTGEWKENCRLVDEGNQVNMITVNFVISCIIKAAKIYTW